MKTFNIGTLRYIEIFSSEDELQQLEWLRTLKSFDVDDLNTQNLRIYGTINGMDPLFIYKDTKKIYVFEGSQKPTIIANSAKDFYEIINMVLLIWEPYKDQALLPRNENVRRAYQDFRNALQLKEIDYEWWFDYAFKELNVYYK